MRDEAYPLVVCSYYNFGMMEQPCSPLSEGADISHNITAVR